MGYGAVDLTRVYTRALAGTQRFGVKYLWNDAPAQVVSGGKTMVRVRAQNTGITTWGAQPNVPVTFHAIWRQGDAVVAESASLNVSRKLDLATRAAPSRSAS